MTINQKIIQFLGGHRIIVLLILCLFGLCVAESFEAPRKKRGNRRKVDERVYLVHANQLSYDQYGRNPDAQVLNGKVHFRHKGANLTCDSAYFYEASNSFEAFGHVKMKQGDTLTLVSDYAYYDGNDQMALARHNVVLTHRGTKLYTDSLDFDRLYNLGYFFEGGKMVDKKNVLTSDWGEYHTETREAIFNYNVHLKNPKFLLLTDTLHYNTLTSVAHIVGPSKITSGASVINTSQGYYNTNTEKAQLFGRSTLVNKQKELTGDSLYYDEKVGISEGFRNVVYEDKENKNRLYCDRFWYNEQTGDAYATERAKLVDYSQKDTLYMHADSMKMYSHNLETDSVWREIHCFNKVRMYRMDVQAVCDSLVYNTKDSCMTMYKDPITWNLDRQLLGEVIEIFMKDSTIDRAHVIGQASSIEKIDEENHYNQVSSKEMFAYFIEGAIHESDAQGNVLAIYYPVDDKDSSFVGMNYTETEEMKMYLKDRKLQKIWMPKAEGTLYPMTQIPPGQMKLQNFAWFDYIRPVDKDDIFNWRGKGEGNEIKVQKRHAAPLQTLGLGASTPAETKNNTGGKSDEMNAVDEKTAVEKHINKEEKPTITNNAATEELAAPNTDVETLPVETGTIAPKESEANEATTQELKVEKEAPKTP